MRTRRGTVNDDDDDDDDDSDDLSDEASHEDSENDNDDDDDDDDEQEDSSEAYETDDDEEESNLIQKKTLLFLCQEGQIRLARRRLQLLQKENEFDKLQKEVFQMGPDKNYPLHEVIMGGTLEDSSKNIIPELLEIGKQCKGPFLVMLNAQPPSHGRTALHWAAWGNASFDILRPLAMANPEALILRDGKTHGSRTPLEIFKRYHLPKPGNVWHEWAMKKLSFLETTTQLWTQHRLRLAVYKAVLYWFRHKSYSPFDKKGRKETGITPKHWFYLSVMGYCLQREMEPLLWRILGFVGGSAQITKLTKRKRRRS
ncbi:unnamed protein product [Cylindrotheca closterium]|uniref:Uncharacterized protein n=1 Tax=Cylindrotheca closterium TaxID=2856 RepID=A0AAD2JLS9_9STRA|nr:unnamed protein product [Cylindrotheca closterium]